MCKETHYQVCYPPPRVARSGGYSIRIRPSVRPEPCQQDISRRSRPISILFGTKVPIGDMLTPVDFGDLGVIFKVVTIDNVSDNLLFHLFPFFNLQDKISN